MEIALRGFLVVQFCAVGVSLPALFHSGAVVAADAVSYEATINAG